MPTKQEMKVRHGWVGNAVDQIVAAGVTADGQVSVTRKATKSLARVARARGAKMIVIDETPESGIRRIVEGDVGTELRKKLRKDGIKVHVIPYYEPALSSV